MRKLPTNELKSIYKRFNRIKKTDLTEEESRAINNIKWEINKLIN